MLSLYVFGTLDLCLRAASNLPSKNSAKSNYSRTYCIFARNSNHSRTYADPWLGGVRPAPLARHSFTLGVSEAPLHSPCISLHFLYSPHHLFRFLHLPHFRTENTPQAEGAVHSQFGIQRSARLRRRPLQILNLAPRIRRTRGQASPATPQRTS
jgi:hypothetical protein